jgi:glycosyltransferase involved in cell wall biosynthesis
VVHVGWLPDPLGRDPSLVLDDWSTLTDTALLAASGGAEVDLVVASKVEHAPFRRAEGTIHFVCDTTRMLPLRLVERIAGLHPDIVHVHGLGFFRQTLHVAMRVPRARILLQDHADRPLSGWRRVGQRCSLGAVAGVIFTSRDQAIPFREAGVLPRSTPVFELLESTSSFVPGDREKARRITGMFGDPCVLWVGNLDRNKDIFAALDAVEMALAELPLLELFCCFKEAPEIAAVHNRLARSPALERRVHLLGKKPRRDLEMHHRSADLFMVASRRESTCYSAIDAMACGAAPVLTDIPAFRRITRNGDVGALAPVGDARSLSENLVALARCDRTMLRRNIREHFDAELSRRVQQSRLMRLYQAVVS